MGVTLQALKGLRPHCPLNSYDLLTPDPVFVDARVTTLRKRRPPFPNVVEGRRKKHVVR